MRSGLTLVVLVCSVLGLGTVRAATDASQVSKRDVVSLVTASLPLHARKLPKLGLDVGIDKQYRQFDLVTVTWAGTPNGSAVYGSYYVDRQTGDVWDAVEECTKIDTLALRKLQATIRKRLGLSESAYQKQKRKGPLCP